MGAGCGNEVPESDCRITRKPIFRASQVGLGFAAQKAYRWAFLAGVALYSADIITLIVTFSLLSVGVHGFFVLKWFQGQKALKDLKDATVTVGR
jgi:hypothetical protein